MRSFLSNPGLGPSTVALSALVDDPFPSKDEPGTDVSLAVDTNGDGPEAGVAPGATVTDEVFSVR